jgi:hypothetical protein
MRVGIYTNKLKDSDGIWTSKIQTELKKYGIEHVEIRQDSTNYDIDLLLVLGGDGTILKLVNYLVRANVPVIGINAGKVGFLAEFEIFEIEEAVNTAVAAQKVATDGDNSVAVICSLEAGHEYGLKLLDRKINENNTNTTRFGVFSRIPRGESVGDEHFILLFTVRDEAGSLCKAVSVFSELGYNLKALKSRPSKDVIWNYYFFLEGEGNLTAEAEAQMLSKLSEVCTNVRLVGRYPKEQSI